MHLTPPPVRRPWWAVVLLGLGVLFMAAVACSYATGHTATLTVTGSTGAGFCAVTWQDPDGTRRTSRDADCAGEPPGTRLVERVSGWPDSGSPSYGSTYVGVALLFGLPPALVGGLVLSPVRLRRRSPDHSADPTPRAAGTGQVPALASDRTAAAARGRGRSGGLLLAGGVVCVALFAVAVAVGSAADEDLRRTGRTVPGTVVSVEPDTRYDPGGARVRVTLDGRDVVRHVDLGSEADHYSAGQQVEVVYDPADLERTTVDDVLYEPGWAGLLGVLGFAGALLLLPGGALVLRADRGVRRLLTEGVWTPVQVRVTSWEKGLEFTTPGGVVWRARSDGGWPLVDREPRALSGWGLPDEDPVTVPHDQPAWWVSDGTSAVFSPDRGAPLVLAHRRR